MIEQRKSPRVQEKANVTVRVQSSPNAPELEGRVFSCYSSDVSFEGIQMCVDIDVPCGFILELEIIFSNSSEKHWQMGYVIWRDGSIDESLGEGDWYNIGVGFDIFINPQFSSWKTTVLNLLANNEGQST
jgi:hypothetical protein